MRKLLLTPSLQTRFHSVRRSGCSATQLQNPMPELTTLHACSCGGGVRSKLQDGAMAGYRMTKQRPEARYQLHVEAGQPR